MTESRMALVLSIFGQCGLFPAVIQVNLKGLFQYTGSSQMGHEKLNSDVEFD